MIKSNEQWTKATKLHDKNHKQTKTKPKHFNQAFVQAQKRLCF